jgi:hypothetical protein
LKVDKRNRRFCTRIVIGIRMANSMEGPWIPLTLYTQPDQDIAALPPGVGETEPRLCEAFAPKEGK